MDAEGSAAPRVCCGAGRSSEPSGAAGMAAHLVNLLIIDDAALRFINIGELLLSKPTALNFLYT